MTKPAARSRRTRKASCCARYPSSRAEPIVNGRPATGTLFAERALGVHIDEGVDRGVELLDARERRSNQLDRRNVAIVNHGGQFEHRPIAQILHGHQPTERQ